MTAQPRKFEIKPARRSAVPVMIGIMGTTGSGKTYSALRLATGICSVVGGKPVLIDTEGKRGTHYADTFNYDRIQFDPPFRAEDYLAAIQQAESQGAGCIIVDSMSHEHEGAGGLLDRVETYLNERAGQDWTKRDKFRMAAFIEPKRARNTLVLHLERSAVSTILCFKAKEQVKPVMVKGKMEIVDVGWQPIGGDELMYAMTASALLTPNSRGVPTWTATRPGEQLIVKRPEFFRNILSDKPEPLSESMGKAMAQWAKGDTTTKAPANEVPKDVDQDFERQVIDAARAAARKGGDALQAHWEQCSEAKRDILRDHGGELRDLADKADAGS